MVKIAQMEHGRNSEYQFFTLEAEWDTLDQIWDQTLKEYIKMMLNTPQYKNNKNLIALNNRFDELWVRKQVFMRDVERSEELSGTFFRQNLDAN